MTECANPRCDWQGDDHEDDFPCARIIDSWGNTEDLRDDLHAELDAAVEELVNATEALAHRLDGEQA